MFKAILDLFRQRALMRSVYDDVAAMFEMAASHFDAAASALLDGETIGFDVYAADRRINERVVSIRKRIVEHLTINRPHDVIGELVFLTVINDIERVGDYAKTLVDTRRDLKRPLPSGPYLDGLREQRDILLAAFPRAQKALLDGDAEAGGDAIARLDGVRELSQALLSALFDETGLTPAEAIGFGLTARVFYRAAKHLKNAASAATGTFVLIGYGEDRDSTSDGD